MSKKLTHEEYVKRLSLSHPHIQAIDTYQRADVKMRYHCNIHDEDFYMTPIKLKSGRNGCQGCKSDARIKRGAQHSHEEYCARVIDINPYIEILSPYTNIHSIIKYRCNVCKVEFEVTASNLLRKRECTSCGRKTNALSLEQYQEKLKNKFPHIQCEGNYKSLNSKLNFICTIDNHQWTDYAKNVLVTGCKVCNGSIYDTERYKKQLSDLNGKIIPVENYKKATVKIKHRCDICNAEITDSPNNIINKLKNGYSACCCCSDGVSYANKFSYAFLRQLSDQLKEVTHEFRPSWCIYYDDNGNSHHGKYDNMFVLPNNKKIILEMDGYFHYIDNWLSGQSAKLSSFIDSQKDYCAREHNYVIVRIDCNYQNLDRFEYIKKNMETNSLLQEFFDMSNIDWGKIALEAEKSYFNQCIQLWKEKEDVKEIAKELDLDVSTIRNYLNRARKLDICDYDPKKEIEKSYTKMKQSVSKRCLCITTNKYFNSISDGAQYYQTNASSVSLCCLGKRKHAGKYNGVQLEWKYA